MASLGVGAVEKRSFSGSPFDPCPIRASVAGSSGGNASEKDFVGRDEPWASRWHPAHEIQLLEVVAIAPFDEFALKNSVRPARFSASTGSFSTSEIGSP